VEQLAVDQDEDANVDPVAYFARCFHNQGALNPNSGNVAASHLVCVMPLHFQNWAIPEYMLKISMNPYA